jgi:pimeloyl-ACP methyl ester carboxylesterase
VSEELEPDTTSLMWAPNIEALSREYRTVAVDQMGEFGKSVCAKPIRTLQDLIAWLDELIGTLAARTRVSLVGMSYGGALATQYALHFPERLEKVVLLAPGATVLRPPAEFWVRLMGPGIARQKGLRAFFRWVFADMARTDNAMGRVGDRAVVAEHAEHPAAQDSDSASVDRYRMEKPADPDTVPGR